MEPLTTALLIVAAIAGLNYLGKDARTANRTPDSRNSTTNEDYRSATLGPCPASYTDGNDGNCYKVFANFSNYYKASSRCKSDGGMLVSIDNEQKNAMVAQMAEEAGFMIWLGLQCTISCSWEDDRQIFYSEFLVGNPNHIGKCVVMMIGEQTKGKWASADCDYMKTGFICQIARKELCGDYIEHVKGAKCYKKVDQGLSHDEAESYCQNECGHLASIHCVEENDCIVNELFMGRQIYARIGLRHSDGIYSWADNSTFDYNNFGYNNSLLGDCVAISLGNELIKAKEWINVDCELPLPFICQRERGACFNTTITYPERFEVHRYTCDEPKYLEQNGTIYSPFYPYHYRDPKACYYVMIAPPGNVVEIHFEDIELNTRAGDIIHIYNAFTDTIPSETITSVVPSTMIFTSTTNTMKMIYVPGNGPVQYDGQPINKSKWKVVFDSKKKT